MTVFSIGVVQIGLTPIVFYPFAKALWLAIDLVFWPVRPEDVRYRFRRSFRASASATNPPPSNEILAGSGTARVAAAGENVRVS